MAEHRLPPEILDPVHRLASRMQGVMVQGRLLSRAQAESRIESWINNFTQLGVDAWLVIQALGQVEMLYDDQILDRCLDMVTDLHPESLDADRVFYAPLGDATESSARIMRGFNFMRGWAPDLPTLLAGPALKDIRQPVIIFVDDFLNSGGQLRKILETWAGRRSYDAAGAGPGSGRRPLGQQGLKIMNRARLLFVFRFGMEQGRARAEETLEALGWDGVVRCVGTLDDHVGIFGTANDRDGIEAGAEELVSNASSAFKDKKCRELTRFLAACEQAGEALLRLRKPDWPEDRYRGRRLGYGNSAKLFLTQYNVPTCTLTCLWAGGRIKVLDRWIDWKPLVGRRDKAIGGVETLRGNAPARKMSSEVDLTGLLRELPLDSREGATAPLEVALWARHDAPADGAPCEPWQRITRQSDRGPQSYLDLLHPEAREALGFGPGGGAAVWSLPPAALGPVNNRLSLEVDGQHHGMKVQSATYFCFPGGSAATALRFQFQGDGLDLLTAGTISHVMARGGDRSGFRSGAIVQRSARRDGSFPRSSLDRLLGWAQASTRDPEARASSIFDPQPQPPAPGELQALTFIREEGGLFDLDDGRMNRALGALASFVNPRSDRAARVSADATIEYDASAAVGISRKGVVWLCGGDQVINHSYAPEQYFRAYLMLHALAHSVAAANRKVRLSGDSHGSRVQWLRQLRRFPWGDVCQLPRMSRFLGEMAHLLQLEQNLSKL